MKISNETKVGALAAIAITVLILGYSYLKGDRLFSTEKTYYAEYNAVSGLSTSDDVILRGYPIGKIKSIDLKSDSVVRFVVAFTIDDDIVLPRDSEAKIVSSDLLGDKNLEIILGTSNETATSGDFLIGTTEVSLQESITEELLPVKNRFEQLIQNIDSVIIIIQSTFDQGFQSNIDENMVSIREALLNVRNASERLDLLIASQSESIDRTMANVESISRNLTENQDKINRVFNNVANISDSLARINFTETMIQVNKAVADFAAMMSHVEGGEGNLGQLVYGEEVYQNLDDASQKLNRLIEDMQNHPNRYLPDINLLRIGGGDKRNTPEPQEE